MLVSTAFAGTNGLNSDGNWKDNKVLFYFVSPNVPDTGRNVTFVFFFWVAQKRRKTIIISRRICVIHNLVTKLLINLIVCKESLHENV